MKVLILNACAVVCKNKPESTDNANYNRTDFNISNNPVTSSAPKREANDNSVSQKLIHQFVDFSGGMLGI